MTLAATSHRSMDIWGPRRATSLKEARARTGLVHIIRLLFTVGAVLSAGMLLGPVVQHQVQAGRKPLTAPSLNVTILNPRFEGRDINDRPYVITADTAHRRRENVALIDLVNPHLEDEASTSVEAREGVFDRDRQVLDLVGDVTMMDAAGYRFTSDSTRMYVRENRVEGLTPLKGFGAVGEVRADAYEVLDDGNKIVLKGHVWTRFTPKSAGGAGGGRNR